jgi:hypothetical protein
VWAGGPIAGAVFAGSPGEQNSSHTVAWVRRRPMTGDGLRACRWGTQ